MNKLGFLTILLVFFAAILININILYGFSLYIVPLILYSFVLLLYRKYSFEKSTFDVSEGRSDLLFIVVTSIVLWFVIGFLIGFGLNIMIVLPLQYFIILIYRMSQVSALEVVRRILLDNLSGLNISLIKMLFISIVVVLLSFTYGELTGLSISNTPEIIVMLINSMVLTVIGYYYDFKSQAIVSLLNAYLFSLSPILLDVTGTIKFMLESFVFFTQFLIVYYLNTNLESFKRGMGFVVMGRLRRFATVFFKYLGKVLFILIIVLMISFLLGFRGLAIVSNSMNPVISRGDMVFININDHDIDKGDIIAFTYGDKIIVHRVYRIDKETFTILTKGDANQNIDPWTVTDKNYVGKYVASIPFLGYPSIYISRLFTSPVVGISLTVTLILAFIIITLMKEMVHIS